jgi:hypothetical protein
VFASVSTTEACLDACWALMLPVALAGHAGLLLMVVHRAIVGCRGRLVKGTGLGGAAAVILLAVATAA